MPGENNETVALDPKPADIDIPQEVYDKYSDEDLSLALAGEEENLKSEEIKSEKTTETSDDDKTPETPEDKSSEETLDGEQSSSDDETKGKKKEDEEESSSENQTELSDLELEDDEEIVVELDNGEVIPLNQIVEDFNNDREWQKSNTEKSQEIADRRREIDETVETLGTEEIQKALANDNFMEAVDEWFEGKEKNPFRKSEGIKEYSDKELKLIQDDVSLQIDREIFDLQKSDKSLDDEKKVSELVQFAAKEGLRVPIAYKVLNHDKLTEKINSLTSELKKTNKELSQLKEKPVITPKKSVKDGKGAKTEDYSEPAKDFDEARERASKELDRLIAMEA